MKLLQQHFDDFTLRTRVMPAIVVWIPIIILVINKGFVVDDVLKMLSTYGIITVVMLTVMSKITRQMGKIVEKKMYNKLGGMPTTILLRFSDNTIDSVSKAKYHNLLNKRYNLNLPLVKEEENIESDEQYKAAINSLRNYSNSHREDMPRVYIELVEYNFLRNLYGIKYIALIIYFVIAIREIFILDEIDLKQMFINPYPEYVSLLIMIASMILVSIFINKKSVVSSAFVYAKTLIETLEYS